MAMKRNAEGYHDPTACDALSNVIREERRKAYRALVFICSPYAGDMEGNARRAREYCRFAVAQNCIPLAPHLYFPQFMEEGLKYQPIGISPDQAQFLETRKFQLNEIARIFRVPPHMVGDLEKSSFSNIEQQSLEFVKYTLEPWLMRWEQAMGRRLFTEGEKESYFIRFNVEGLLRGDYESRMNGYAVARQNGWMSANDIRGLENLDRIPAELGGDLYLVNGSMTKLADAGAFAGDAGADTRAAAAAGNRGNGGNGK